MTPDWAAGMEPIFPGLYRDTHRDVYIDPGPLCRKMDMPLTMFSLWVVVCIVEEVFAEDPEDCWGEG